MLVQLIMDIIIHLLKIVKQINGMNLMIYWLNHLNLMIYHLKHLVQIQNKIHY